MIRFLAITIITLITSSAFAAEEAPSSNYKVKIDEKQSRLIFGIYTQLSQFTRTGTALTGYNLEGSATYALSDRTAALLSIAQSLDTADGISVLFTGVRLGFGYTIFGNYLRLNTSVKVNEQETVSILSDDRSLLATDLGIEQYLFNATDRVVPATGLSLGLRYDRTIFGFRASGMIRYGSLVIQAETASLITAGVGLLMRF